MRDGEICIEIEAELVANAKRKAQKVFTDDEVRQIRAEYVGRKEAMRSPNVIELANRYGVSQETIRKIALGHSYKDVDNA